MFSIVSMQDVLVNLNGSENLFKQFDRPRSRKRSTTVKSSKDKTQPFTINKIWIIPGHILVLSSDDKIELTAYDQLHKIGPYTSVPKNLLVDVEESSGVVDLIYDCNHHQYIFIIFKTGTFLVYAFSKPKYEWKHIFIDSLCKGKTAQVSSILYNQHGKVLVWSEKRSTAQFCICTASVMFSGDGQHVTVSRSKSLLHNCLPMNIGLISKNDFCFLPSSPAGLMLFWSVKSNDVNLHMWGEDFNKISIPASSSDFQSIVTSSISLWSGSPANEIKIIASATHPTTQELLVLQSDLQLHVVRKNDNGKIVTNVLCNLEVESEKENFAKQVIGIYPTQRLLLVTKMDGVIDMFDVRAGLFLWKTTTFKANSPNIWVRLGPHPAFGIWNKSGIWNLRPKPIADQIQEFKSRKYPDQLEENKSAKKYDDVEFALDVFGEQKKSNPPQGTKQRRIKQGVNRTSALPIQYLLQVLNQWRLSNVSADMVLSVMLKIKDIMNDSNTDEELDTDELMYIIHEINDPVLLLTLFSDKLLPFSIKKKVVLKITDILEHTSAKYLDKKILRILKEYVEIDKEIKALSVDHISNDNMLSHETMVEKELSKLQKKCCSGIADIAAIDVMFTHLFGLEPESFVSCILQVVLPKDFNVVNIVLKEDKVHEKFYEVTWKVLLRSNSITLTLLVRMLWEKSPSIFMKFIQQACHVIKEMNSANEKDVVTKASFIDHILRLIILPADSECTNISDLYERVDFYCLCLQMSSKSDCEEEAYELFLHHKIYLKAFDILRKHNNNSQLHYTMFYKLFVGLVKNKVIGKYVDALKEVLPKKFNLAEATIIVQNNLLEVGNGPVFVKTSNEISIEMLKPLFAAMLCGDDK